MDSLPLPLPSQPWFGISSPVPPLIWAGRTIQFLVGVGSERESGCLACSVDILDCNHTKNMQ